MSGTEPSALSAIKVLIVEDNIVNQKVTSAMLNHFGIVPDIAENGQIAVDMAKSAEYDVILMDCQMPVMNGFDATRGIRALVNGQTSNTVPVLAMTANTSADAREQCYESGMNDIIPKPVELDTLSEKLTDWCKSDNHQTADSNSTTDTSDEQHTVLDSAFNMKMVNELYDLMGEDMHGLYATFSTSLEENIPLVAQAIEQGDAETIATVTHTLKGSCANVGAAALSGQCQELMEEARKGELSAANEHYDRIKEEYTKVRAALDKYLDQA